jgi:hypothetical protein
MALRDKLSSFTCRFHRAAHASCLGEKDIAAARLAATLAFPKQSTWHPLRYPGEISLPIFTMPLAPSLEARLSSAIAELKAAMQKEGYTDAQTQISSRFEQPQAHIWLAMLAEGQYLPIGQLVFILEQGRPTSDGSAAASAPPGGLRLERRESQPLVGRWWLRHVWLGPAYRCQRIFRHSVPYLNGWHPGFLVRDPGPPLARALKEHPEHVFDAVVSWH